MRIVMIISVLVTVLVSTAISSSPEANPNKAAWHGWSWNLFLAPELQAVTKRRITGRMKREPVPAPAPYNPADDEDNVPTSQVVGVAGYPIELECNVQPTKLDDQLQLVLWYKEGHRSPIYTFDARGKHSPDLATHYSDDAVFGSRARMVVPKGAGITDKHQRRQHQHQSAKLVVESLRVEDRGIYKCRTDFKRSPTKNYRRDLSILTLPTKPVIHDGSGRKMTAKMGPYKVGDEIVATCTTAGGDPPPTLSWWREQALIDDSYEVINGQTTNMLRIPAVQRHELGVVYTCQAINNDQRIPVSTSLTMDLTFPPVDVSVLGDRSRPLSAGREEQIQCRVKGSRPVPEFRWFIGSRELETTGRRMDVMEGEEVIEAGFASKEHDPVKDPTALATLRFIPQPEDHGKYLMCRAANEYFPARSKEDGYVLNVRYVPSALLEFGPSLNPKSIKEGDDVYFECHVRSNPATYNITWRHNGKFVMENVPGGVLLGNQTLVLQRVKRSHAGLYTCVASNSEGDGESNAQYLNVKFLPQCRSNQRLTYGATRQNSAGISCFVDANPYPNDFIWQIEPAKRRPGSSSSSGGTSGGKRHSNNNRQEKLDVPASDYTSQHDHSVLQYSPRSEADYGTVLCWGVNEVGRQREPCRFKIVKESAPDPLKNCKINNITWEDLSVSCEFGFDGGHEANYHLEVYESSKYLANNLTRTEPSFQMHHLKGGHDYTLLLYASNVLGRSQARRFNATTLNVADKRTAETRSKLPASSLEDTAAVSEDGGASELEAKQAKAHAGLELLPIVAILCGVAVGLVTVAVGVLLLVKSRGGGVEEAAEGAGGAGTAAAGPSERRDGRGKYDAVSTSVPQVDDADFRQIKPGSAGDLNEYLGSLPRGTHPGHVHKSQQSSRHAVHGNSETSSLSSQRSLGRRQQRYQRTVHFEPQGGLPTSPTDSQMARPPSRHHHHAAQQQHPPHQLQRDLQILDQALLPPASFSDTASSSGCSSSAPPPTALRKVSQPQLQQLRVQAVTSGGSESSFVTFCPPNLETKTRDIVNATRL